MTDDIERLLDRIDHARLALHTAKTPLDRERALTKLQRLTSQLKQRTPLPTDGEDRDAAD